MFGHTSSGNQWSEQGYSRNNYSKPSVTDSYSSSRPWNQKWPSESDSTTQDQSWQNDNSISNSRTNSSHFQSSIGLQLGAHSNTFSDQSNTSKRPPWLSNMATTPPPLLNRKRPLELGDEDSYRESSYNSNSNSWSGQRSNEWPRSDKPTRSRSKEWTSSDDWSESEVMKTPWIEDNKRPNAWPRSDDRPRLNPWSKPKSDPWPRSTDNLGPKFPRIDVVQNIPTWSRPRPQKNVETDVGGIIITSYYVSGNKMNMPKELTAKFGPLKCDLCGVLVNSTVTAKTHYTGKMHDKKVSQYMHKWFSERGEPIPEQFKEGVPKKNISNDDGKGVSFYCGVCDLPLSSKQHAEQHYMGKSHKKSLMNGKTQKIPVKQDKPDPTGRFRIGEKFIQSTDPLGLKSTETPEQSTPINGNPYYCTLCTVSTTSADQLATHKSGSRHQKKLKVAAMHSTGMAQVPPPAAKGDSILAALNRPNDGRAEFKDGTGEKPKDFSIFRTPSGQFYCAICNTTMNSEVQFGQHNNSKKHKLTVSKSKNLVKPPIVSLPSDAEPMQTEDPPTIVLD